MTKSGSRPGRIFTRRARSTGTLVSLYDAVAAGFETAGEAAAHGLKWATVCETHGSLVRHETRKLATEWMTEPEVWCQQCNEAFPVATGS